MILNNIHRKWSTVGISIFMISAIIIMTPMFMFLNIRPGYGIIKSSVSVAAILETINNGLATDKYNNSLRKTTVTTTDVHNENQSETDGFADQLKNKTLFVELNSTEEQTHTNYSIAEKRNTNTRIQDDRYKVGPTILSKNKKQPIIKVQENQYLNHKFDKPMSTNDDQNNNDQLINNNGMFQNINGYSTVDTDIPMVEGDSSNGVYNNKYDLSYNVDGFGYRDDDIPTEHSIKWTANSNTGQTHIDDSSWPEAVRESDYGRIPYDFKLHYPVNHVLYNKPSVKQPSKKFWPSNNPDDEFDKPTFQKSIQNKLNSENIGILLFIILGLIKLKTIGFLQLMLLLTLKFKLFILAIFFKLSLLLKFIKFFKIQILPLFLISLLPTFVSLFQRLGNMQSSATQSISPGALFSNILDNNGNPLMNSIPLGTSGFSGGSATSSTRPIQTLGTLGSREFSSSNNAFSSLFNSSNFDSIGTKTVSPREIQSSPYPSNTIDETTIFNRPYSELLTSFNSSLAFFRIIFDSQNCVERVACRIAATEKIGRIPLWINWFFRDVLKFISDKKFEAYLKAYNESNVIFTESSIPENWSSWCIEYYK